MAAAASGGVQPLNVQIQITTTGARAAANSMQNVTRASGNMSRSFGAGVISARTLGDAMRMSATLMKYTVAGAFIQAGQAATQAYRNFELSFSRIQGLVGISSDAINQMKQEVLEMATETTRGPEELAEALYFITSAGLRDASTAMSVLQASAKAAASGLGDTKTVADAVTSSINAYGQANLSASHATDVITAAVREGKAEADTMAPAFSKVLPVAAAYGATFEDVAAAMAALSRSGMTAGTAAIYVRQTLSQLMKPSKQASDLLKSVGTSAEDIRRNVQEKGLFAALQELSGRLGGIENAGAFAKVFGNVRALTAVLQLVGPAAAENAVIFERLQNATGDSADAFSAYADTVDADFNKAFAASRVALIELGEAIKPIVTTLLNFSIAMSTIAKTLLEFEIAGLPVIKVLGGIVGVAALIVLGTSALMKTTSGLIRLFANLSITLRGTQVMYDANTRSLVYMTKAQVAAGAATARQQLMQAGYAKALSMSTAAQNMFTAAIARYKLAAAAAGGATGNLAKAFIFLKTAIGTTALVVAAVAAAAAAIYFLKKRSDEANKSFGGTAASLGRVNELLDETVKFGKSNLLFNVDVDVDNAKLKSDMDRARTQIEQDSPEFFSNISTTLAQMGEESKAAYLNSLLTGTFGGMTNESKRVLANLFADQFGISEEQITSAVVPEQTGDAVADALIFAALSGARSASKRASEAIKGGTFEDLNNAIREGMALAEEQRAKGIEVPDIIGGGVLDALKEFGVGFTDVIQETQGNIAPLLVSLQAMEEAGTLTSTTLEFVLGSSLKGLTGALDLQSESAGNLAEIFSKTGNEAGLVAMIMKTTNTSNAEATVIYEDLREQMANLPNDANKSVAAFGLLSKAINNARVETEKIDEAQQEVIKNLSDTQLYLKDVIAEYDEQTKVMQELEKAQRGLLGMNLTQEESLRSLMDQYQSVGDAVAEARGSFSMETESGRAARAELQASAEAVMNLANSYAAAGDAAAAGEVFAEGMANIIKVAGQAGGEGAGVAAADLLAQMGFTSELFEDSVLAAQTSVDASSVATGKALTDGIARGIAQGQGTMSQALVTALKNVVITGQKSQEIESPSKKTARELGMPMAQGVEVGFTKYASSSKFSKSISSSLDKAMQKAQKAGGRKGLSAFLSDFMEKKKDVETPAADFVKATIGRMKDIIGSLSDYINSQLNFRKAQADLAKLINMQKGLDDRRRRAAREAQYAQTRFGMGGGAEVTGYEQARIDELQLAFERTSRDYAMGRATYVDLVDAEIALNEARASASEVNDDVIGAQNDFLDATVEVENASLTLAAATVGVLEAYQDVQEAAAELYMNHKELEGVYKNLAEATGIASGKIVIGTKDMSKLGDEIDDLGGFASTVGGYVSTLGNNLGITGQSFRNEFDGPNGIFAKISSTGSNITNLTNSIGASFTNLSKGLVDPDSQFMKDLKSLGAGVWLAIQTGAQEKLDASPLNFKISVNAVVDKSGSGSINWTVTPPTPSVTVPSTGQYIPGAGGRAEMPTLVTTRTTTATTVKPTTQPKKSLVPPTKFARAVGGPVVGQTPYMVGEKGPEMFVPKVSGTIVTTNALERYLRVKDRNNNSGQGAQVGNSINVVVNNPVPQAAEESITRRMKVLSNSGLFG